MDVLPQKKICSLLYPILTVCIMLILPASAQADGGGLSGSPVETQTTNGGGDSSPTLSFFLLLAGGFSAVLIPLLIFMILLFGWAACDVESMRILRNLGSLNRLRRIVVSQEVWDQLLADPTLRKDMANAGVKIRVEQVESDSPLIKSLIKRVSMKFLGAQALEVARVKNLRYVWVDGNRINVKELLKKMTP